MTPMRIEYVIDHLHVGGAQRHLVELFTRLDRRRFALQVAVAKPGGALTPVIERMGIPVRSFGLGASLGRPSTLARLMATAQRLRAEAVDVVHGYLYLGNILGVLAGRLAGVPILLASKRSLDRYPRRTQLAATRLANRLAHRILCNAEAVRECVLAVERPAPAKLTVIPNGIAFPVAPAHPERPPGVPAGRRLVGSIGRLTWKKSYGDLVEAARIVCRACDDVDLVLIGDGPERSALEAQAARLGLGKRIHFVGEVPDAWRFLWSFDVFVLASVIEGMPNVLLEALAAERPVVVTRAGGMPEIVTDGRTGRLTSPGEPAALADAILGILRTPDSGRRFGQAGRRLVEERYSAETMGARYAALYDELSDARRHPTPLARVATPRAPAAPRAAARQ
jgi:starch synthase (maltosyl-transferring)